MKSQTIPARFAIAMRQQRLHDETTAEGRIETQVTSQKIQISHDNN